MARNVVVVGAQWGDEGKGKVVDLYARDADVIVRFQGGNNAGHTLVVGGEKTVLHLIPSGVLHQGKTIVVANGVVVDPLVLVEELDLLAGRGLEVSAGAGGHARLLVSGAAHVIMPWHKRLDRLRERRRGKAAIGTTGRGIGPTYEDKASRQGIRIEEFVRPDLLRQRVEARLDEMNDTLRGLGGEPFTVDEVLDPYLEAAERIAPHVADTGRFLHERMAAGDRILFEGAQGTLLDLDHGTYPFVTSSNTVAANAATGSGIGPGCLHEIVGITKAYTTRVGAGPFPTELHHAVGDRLREAGSEYGATTGRPRRCGWLDIPALRYAARVNGLTGLAVTKLDVLTGFERLKVCTAYRVGGEVLEEISTERAVLETVEPVYEELPGWTESLEGARDFEALPEAARRYLERIEAWVGVPVILASVGAEREATIILRRPFGEA